jgi:tetratricopeptide (TPR) repeat protein
MIHRIDGRESGRRKTVSPPGRGDPAGELLDLARRFRHVHDHDEAIACYQSVLAGMGERCGLAEYASLRRAIIECLCERGDYGRALQEVEETKSTLVREVDALTRELEEIRLLSATIHVQVGSYDEAEAECERALRRLDGEKRPEMEKRLRMTLGSVALHRGDLAGARRHFEECRDRLEDRTDALELARVFNHMAQLHFVEAEWRTALELLTESLRVCEPTGDGRMRASIIGNLGTVHLMMGNWDAAEDYLIHSLALWNSMGDVLSIVRKYISLGNLHMMRRDWPKADQYYTLSRDLSREKGYMRELCLAQEFSGELAFDRGEYDSARAFYEEALSLAGVIAPDGDLIGEICRRIAELRLRTGDLDGAMEACDRSLSASLRLGDRFEEAVVYRVFGMVLDAMGEVDRARGYFSQGIDGLTAIDEVYERGKTLLESASFLTRRYTSEGDRMMAERHFRVAASIFDRLGVEHYARKTADAWDELKRRDVGTAREAR